MVVFPKENAWFKALKCLRNFAIHACTVSFGKTSAIYIWPSVVVQLNHYTVVLQCGGLVVP